jgi:peptide/nickel transport system substrate-binding protein
MTRLSVSLVLLAAGAALLIAAAVAAASRPTAKGGTLRLGVAVDVKVDPALAISGPELALEYATCAKLFNFPDAAGEAGARVIPEVVDRYVVSRDGKTYIFDLKKTFRFHTGAPVTARSFADAFNRDAIRRCTRLRPTSCTRSSARTTSSPGRRRRSRASACSLPTGSGSG